MAMTIADSHLRHLLLDMVASTRTITHARFDGLGEGDWHALGKMARQHRLGPMLWNNSQAAVPPWPLPPAIADAWQESFRQSAMRSLNARRILSVIDGLLNGTSVRYAALKGAFLCQYAYPHPAMRPLRDIDILVEPDRAVEIFELLLRHNFVRPSDGLVDPATTAIEHKHLPPLYMAGPTRGSGLFIEIHTRILQHIPATIVPGSLDDVGALLGRAKRCDGIAYLSPTDTLLHLILHSVQDHEFNNGPLVFNDVALLLARSTIEWPRFWDMVDAHGCRPACVMVLELAAQYHHLRDWDGESLGMAKPTTAQLESAALLSLQDFDARASIGLQADLAQAGGTSARLDILLRRAFPPLHILSAYAGSSRVSRWSLLRYPDWLFTRAKQRLATTAGDSIAQDVDRVKQVRNWTRGNPPRQ